MNVLRCCFWLTQTLGKLWHAAMLIFNFFYRGGGITMKYGTSQKGKWWRNHKYPNKIKALDKNIFIYIYIFYHKFEFRLKID